MNKTLSIILVILVILFYVQYYSKYNYDYTIVQLYLDQITGNHLLEKNPIVIYDQVIEPAHLLKTLFKYTYVFSRSQNIYDKNHVYNNASKYILIYSKTESIDINIINPKYNKILALKKNKSLKTFSELDQVNYITVKLKPNQVLILPSLWSFHSYQNITTISLQDMFSALYFNMLALFG